MLQVVEKWYGLDSTKPSELQSNEEKRNTDNNNLAISPYEVHRKFRKIISIFVLCNAQRIFIAYIHTI